MNDRYGRCLAVIVVLLLGACASGSGTTERAVTSPVAIPTDLTPTILDVLSGEAEPFTDLRPGRYGLDPDLDPATPLRVTYDVPAGWQSWIGAAKISGPGWVEVSITTVTNLVMDGCRDHSWADPPVGPSVEDLATSLADLAPFRVTSAPKDVSIDGYRGTRLELTVPKDQPFSDAGSFVGCDERNLKSWVAAIDAGEEGDAFYGYTAPGFHEEFWILDVEGTRLMIEAGRSPGSPPRDLEELRAILDSIRIEPGDASG